MYSTSAALAKRLPRGSSLVKNHTRVSGIRLSSTSTKKLARQPAPATTAVIRGMAIIGPTVMPSSQAELARARSLGGNQFFTKVLCIGQCRPSPRPSSTRVASSMPKLPARPPSATDTAHSRMDRAMALRGPSQLPMGVSTMLPMP